MQNFLRILFFIAVVKPFLKLVLGVNVFGKNNLPARGQVILVANHNSHLDAVVLMNLFPLKQLRTVHPVAAADYFMQNAFLAWFSTTFLNILAIPRSGFTKSNNPLTRMGEVLEKGESLILFPEGSRGEPEKMAEFKTGIAHLIQKFPKVPVVPVFTKGLGKSLPKGEAVLVPFFTDIIIGEPRLFTGTKEQILSDLQAAILRLKEQDEQT
jgi:1-acyl-sn-glycerol-3-phosphate acyltransferase